MTQTIRRHWRTSALVTLAGVALAAVLPLIADRAPASRDVVLLTRGMTFVVEGQLEDVNPVIRVTAGERVRFVLRNQTAGMQHDFAIPSWDVATRLLARDEEASVIVKIPDTPGAVEYLCRPHAQMMRGTIEISAR